MTQRTHPTVDRPPGIDVAIGHYRIVGVVGNGSLGPLYIAEQHGIRGVSKTIALKCIRPTLAQSPGFRAQFSSAASIAPRFEHPNVVTIHEIDELGGTYVVGMEYVPGENVASILNKCNTSAFVPSEIAASVVKQAANAVQYLHDRRAASALPVGLGHGEVDASNVFVTYHGTVKVLSVGLGPLRVANVSAASGEHLVDSLSQVGTFAAPEQGKGTPDRRTDVFNLGVILWTCLTGRRPQLARSSGEATTPSQRFVAPSSLRAGVPEELDAIAMRALSPNPLERFPSARAMSEAFDRYLVRRDSLPTPKHIRRWLEQVFDSERASLHMQIAQGRDVESALSRLHTPQRAGGASNLALPRPSMRPRELWSTSQSMFSRLERRSIASLRSIEPGPGSARHEPTAVSSIIVRSMPSTSRSVPSVSTSELARATPPRARQPRTWMVGATMATCAVIALGTIVLLSSSDDSSPFRDASPDSELANRNGRVDVRSTPEGAAVFVDGEPTGLRTPVVLKGLATGRKLLLRVEKAGFASQAQEIEIVEGTVETRAFELIASVGLVHFAGATPGARIYVDEGLIAIDDQKPVHLSVGRHTLRVEMVGALIFSGTVVIVAGEQTIRVDGAETTP